MISDEELLDSFEKVRSIYLDLDDSVLSPSEKIKKMKALGKQRFAVLMLKKKQEIFAGG